LSTRIIQGDCRDVLKTLPDQSIHCCITSPPYFGLRDYGVDGQMGLEETPEAFIAGMVEVFREVRRVLRGDGTLWLNIGDSYAGSGKGGNPDPGSSKQATNAGSQSVGCLYGTGKTAREAAVTNVTRKTFDGIKAKDLIGIPWMLAFALRAEGWYLRQDIIWHKPNPMPESVTDRCTKSHEYIFLLSKSKNYFYDQKAIREPAQPSSVARVAQDVESQVGSDRVPAKTNGNMKAVKFGGNNPCSDTRLQSGKEWHPTQGGSGFTADKRNADASGDFTANKKSVWNVSTTGFKEAHFATFPPNLIEPCIKAGCPVDGTVLDPFFGAGTTGLVADRLQRNCIGIELNPDYAAIAERRITGDAPLFASVTS
jgi:DNA modification methylase